MQTLKIDWTDPLTGRCLIEQADAEEAAADAADAEARRRVGR